MPKDRVTTTILCPICQLPFDSHTTFRATGALVDEHVKTKHPEVVLDPDDLDVSNSRRGRDYLG